MAFFDESQDSAVVRIVYVGPPFAGKTESLRTLNQILKGKSDGAAPYSPSDAYGRTLYFDWFDHCAGLFRGRPIRCQVIAVPGQTTLTERRKMLVDMADCVVFVADSTPARWGKNREFLDEMIPWIKGPQPPIAIVFQLNKQDHAAAYPVDAFKSVLAELHYANPVVRATSATTGDGLRETFITAVSLALDRVHALIEANALPSGKDLDIRDGQQLFDLMTQREQAMPPPSTEPPPETDEKTEAGVAEPASRPEEAPVASSRTEAPVSSVWDIRTEESSGAPAAAKPAEESYDCDLVKKSLLSHVVAGGIYPPVHGRERMYAAVAGLQELAQLPDGAWHARTAEWRIRSTSVENFEGLASARQYLLALAHLCESMKDVLVKERFVAVTEVGDGRCFVWQGIRPGLLASDWLRESGEQPDSLRCATVLFVVAMRLRQLLTRVSGLQGRLVLSLDNMTMHEEELIYSGFLDEPKETGSSAELFVQALMPHLCAWSETRRIEVGELLGGKLRGLLAKNDEQQSVLDAVLPLLGQRQSPEGVQV
ncbi:MAG: GTPase domain-containing protein [Nitrospira sp.]|nr:GTPase domain-containing protein [Nitrospira sp.]